MENTKTGEIYTNYEFFRLLNNMIVITPSRTRGELMKAIWDDWGGGKVSECNFPPSFITK